MSEYREGVSPSGVPLYDKFLGMLDDNGVADCIAGFFFPEVNSKLHSQICQKHLTSILQILRKIAIAERLKGAIDFLLADVGNARHASANPKFRELTAPFIQWK